MGLLLFCFCIKLINALVFPDPDGTIIRILNGQKIYFKYNNLIVYNLYNYINYIII